MCDAGPEARARGRRPGQGLCCGASHEEAEQGHHRQDRQGWQGRSAEVEADESWRSVKGNPLPVFQY